MRRRIFIAVSVLVLGALALAWFQRPSARAERDLARVLADLRDRELATSFELSRGPEPPAESNGWNDVEAAIAWRDHNVPASWTSTIVGPQNYSCVSPWWETASDEELAALSEFLEGLGPLYEHLESAASKVTLRWPPLGGSGLDLLKTSSAAHHMLELREHAAPSGDDRLRAIATHLTLARRLDPRCHAFAGLTAETLLSSACGALRVELERGTIDPLAAREQLGALLKPRDAEVLAQAVELQRTAACQEVSTILDGSFFTQQSVWDRVTTGVTNVVSGRNPFARPLDIDPVLAVRMIADLDAATSLTPTWTRDYDARILACFPERPVNYQPCNSVLFRLHMTRRAEASVRLASVALAAAAHHAADGAWPATLSDLVPLLADERALIDPFTAQPFECTRNGDDLVLRASAWRYDISTETFDEMGTEDGAALLIWRVRPR